MHRIGKCTWRFEETPLLLYMFLLCYAIAATNKVAFDLQNSLFVWRAFIEHRQLQRVSDSRLNGFVWVLPLNMVDPPKSASGTSPSQFGNMCCLPGQLFCEIPKGFATFTYRDPSFSVVNGCDVCRWVQSLLFLCLCSDFITPLCVYLLAHFPKMHPLVFLCFLPGHWLKRLCFCGFERRQGHAEEFYRKTTGRNPVYLESPSDP